MSVKVMIDCYETRHQLGLDLEIESSMKVRMIASQLTSLNLSSTGTRPLQASTLPRQPAKSLG